MAGEISTQVGEPVRVLASFDHGKIDIHFFCYRERIYKVKKLNLFHIKKDENEQIYNFAVSCENNSYAISYNPMTLEWRLEEIVGE